MTKIKANIMDKLTSCSLNAALKPEGMPVRSYENTDELISYLLNEAWLKNLEDREIYKIVIKTINKYLKQGANINGNNKHFTPLNIAVGRQSFELCKFFIKKGADVNKSYTDPNGMTFTPLIYILRFWMDQTYLPHIKNNKKIFLLLVKHGANFKEHFYMPKGVLCEETQIHVIKWIVENEDWSNKEDIIKTIIKFFPDFIDNFKFDHPKYGVINFLMLLCAQHPHWYYHEKSQFEEFLCKTCKFYIKNKSSFININQKNEQGFTALDIAKDSRYKQVCKLLNKLKEEK